MSNPTASGTDTPRENLIVIAAISLILSAVLIFGNEAHPLAILVYWWPFYIIGWAVGTENGRKRMREIWEDANDRNNQPQQEIEVGGNSEPTKICPECGWENPKSNSFCHDCGYQLTKEQKND